jgi:xylan 1,4-beta-xylosidase
VHRLSRSATVLFALLAPVLAGLVSSPPAGAAAAQPPPTSTPNAPGIAIARAKFDLPDPFLLDANGTYYLYLSTAFHNTKQHIPLLTGSPGSWSTRSLDAVPTLPSWAAPDPAHGGNVWAPSVYKLNGRYVMYFSPTIKYSLPVQHCIAIATSSSPAGPFRAAPNPFVCQRNLGGDIDAQLFVDPSGPDGPSRPNYLVWKSDNNSTKGDGKPTIWAQPLSNNGMQLLGQAVRIYVPNLSWQKSLIEAPQMVLSPSSSVWLFYSAGAGFNTNDYGMGVVSCVGPLGPCAGQQSSPFLTSNSQGPGPGEETFFVGPDGSNWLLYSPVRTGVAFYSVRPVEAARIGWGGFGPDVATAGTFPSP